MHRLCLAVGLLAGTVLSEDFSSWPHHKDIGYDTSPGGADVAGDVTGFPVLVRLRSPDFPFAEARGDGRDLRFGKPDGATALPFEIDRYDSAAGAADIWVLADTVKGGSKGALMRLYWGAPGAGSSADSGRVFTAANGFAAVWHLGGSQPTPRANSVPGGMDAVPGNYDSDEQASGVIGFADSLDGAGDHLRTWQAFGTLSKAFSFSIWAYPTAAANWGRFLDFGNGALADNLILTRLGTSNDLRFENFSGTKVSWVIAREAIALDQWQHFAVTVSGKAVNIYRNGEKAAAGELADTITAIARDSQFIGRGNWPDNDPYRGKVDEPQVSAVVRGPDWIKLAYANQKPDQKLLRFIEPIVCQARFAPPGDTALPEGATVRLAAAADCATGFFWSQIGGPALRLLDPETKELELVLPRVGADTAVVLGFTARFGDSSQAKEIRISIRNTIPDPALSLPDGLTWDGGDSLLIKPVIPNRSALESGNFPPLRLDWSLEGFTVDTLQRPEGLLLLPTRAAGELIVSLCVDNGGAPACDSVPVGVGSPTGPLPVRPGPAAADRERAGYGADGRLRKGAAASPRFHRPGADRTAP